MRAETHCAVGCEPPSSSPPGPVVPRFAFANALRPNLKSPSFKHPCSSPDAFVDDGVLHLFFPYRWQRVEHLTLRESAPGSWPTKAHLNTSSETK
jgi:hypothetical protein